MPFYHPPNNSENQNFEKKRKWKKCLELLSFHTYINENHMIYGSWNIRCDGQKFFSFWAIFCTFSPLTTWKIKVLKLKKHLEILSLTHVYHKWQSVDEWFLRYEAWQTKVFVIFDCFLAFYPIITQKLKILKNLKNTRRYYHFTHV